MTTFHFRSQTAATDAYLRASEALVPGFASWGGADLSLSPACLLAGRDPIWIGRLVSAETREERRAWAIDALGEGLEGQVGDLLAAAIGLDDSRVSLWCLPDGYLVRLEGSRAERVASGLLWDVARHERGGQGEMTMNIKQIIEALPEGFERMSFERRVEELTKLLGPPTKKWREWYPSGSGSSYATWEQPEPHDVVCLETGGYDMALERSYPRLPYVGGRKFRAGEWLGRP